MNIGIQGYGFWLTAYICIYLLVYLIEGHRVINTPCKVIGVFIASTALTFIYLYLVKL